MTKLKFFKICPLKKKYIIGFKRSKKLSQADPVFLHMGNLFESFESNNVALNAYTNVKIHQVVRTLQNRKSAIIIHICMGARCRAHNAFVK